MLLQRWGEFARLAYSSCFMKVSPPHIHWHVFILRQKPWVAHGTGLSREPFMCACTAHWMWVACRWLSPGPLACWSSLQACCLIPPDPSRPHPSPSTPMASPTCPSWRRALQSAPGEAPWLITTRGSCRHGSTPRRAVNDCSPHVPACMGHKLRCRHLCRVGNELGAGRPREAFMVVFSALAITPLLWAVIACILVEPHLQRALLHLYVDGSDAALWQSLRWLLTIVAVIELADGLQTVLGGVVQVRPATKLAHLPATSCACNKWSTESIVLCKLMQGCSV